MLSETHPLRFLRNLGRSREIAAVLLKHGFGDIVQQVRLDRYLRWGRRVILRQRNVPEHHETRAAAFAGRLKIWGRRFVKFGQVLSTRPDLIPAPVIAELSRLQEHVRPFPSDQVLRVLEEELGRPVRELFAAFDPVPLAAGSLGQVHKAQSHDGRSLAVKVRRPNVVREVERDLSLMAELALLVERHIPEADVFDPVGLVNHFARTIRRELNFAREGRTIEEFARLFRNDATLAVPEVYWDLSTEAVLTMDFVAGCRIDDREALAALRLDPAALASRGAASS